MFDLMKDTYGYKTPEECFEDRDNNRPLWHQGIRLFCYHNKAALFEAIFKEADAYVGNRNIEEYSAAKRKGLFHFTIWTDGSKRKELESVKSFNITPDVSDYVLDNNGTLSDLERELDKLAVLLCEIFPYFKLKQ
jgi:hypothetical protein